MGDKSILYFSSKGKWITGSVDAMWIVNCLEAVLYDGTQLYQFVCTLLHNLVVSISRHLNTTRTFPVWTPSGTYVISSLLFL